MRWDFIYIYIGGTGVAASPSTATIVSITAYHQSELCSIGAATHKYSLIFCSVRGGAHALGGALGYLGPYEKGGGMLKMNIKKHNFLLLFYAVIAISNLKFDIFVDL